MKKLAVIAKGVCVNGLICSAAAILLTACGAGMPDGTKSQPSKFAGVMQVSAKVATDGPDADRGSAGADADQAAAAAASGAAEQVAAGGMPTPPAADQTTPSSTGLPPVQADVQQASIAGAPAAAGADQVAAGASVSNAAGTAAAQGADSFALVGYGASPANKQAPGADGPVWPDPQDSVSSAIQR